ncbi:LPS-assembly lipoprotein LptE [Atopomonas sediminilitoris]|uniref:LPS-assembly lipoprotein LptE n=1 Tax=Atopomonas sediminilitoris TaxID=2919919 RepID=UPI001F4DE51E|nr:LPS assembly lipoprotein LptE [Atopomonas sediminilitoris]MCJ8170663.1 LPS assembly lipoprotein LptE [Atopomonas sediminilitoris]
MKNNTLSALLVLVMSSLLVACGFQLRGTGAAAFQLQTLNVTARDTYGELQKDVRQALENAGVAVNSSAPFTLDLAQEKREVRTASYSYSTQSAENRLMRSLDYQIRDNKGLVLLSDRIDVERYYSTYNAISNTEQEAQLDREIRNDVVQQLMLRLQQLTTSQLEALQRQEQAKQRAEQEARAAAQQNATPAAQ